MSSTVQQFAKQAAALAWKDALRRTAIAFDRNGGLNRGVTGLAGALLGGGTGAIVDMLDGDDDSPWDAALIGAGLGGGIGASGIANRFVNRKIRSFLPQYNTLSTGETLPKGYREKAVEAARAYRSKLKNSEHEFMQDLSDEAIDRQVPVVQDTGFEVVPSWAEAAYLPLSDTVRYKPDGGQIKLDDPYLGHELVHAQQREGILQQFRDLDGELYGPTVGSRKITEAIDLPPEIRRLGELDLAEYLGDPFEEEAYLAPLKRDYFRQTGKIIDTPQKAKQFLQGAASGDIDVDWKNNPILDLIRMFENDRKTPEAQEGSLEEYLEEFREVKPYENPRKDAQESYLDYLSRILPGIVKNINIRQTAKQAAELSIK